MGKWINADYIKAVMKGDRLMQGNCEYELWKQEVDKKVDAMPGIEVMDVVTAYQQGWCDALDASIKALNDAKFQLANADRKTEPSNSEKPNDCDYAENPSGDVWECSCYQTTLCEHQKEDFNPDGTISIVECKTGPQVKEERVMTREDAIYWIKNLAVLSTEKEIPQIEEALSMAVEALQDEVWKDKQTERSK